jgi:hypothetical protein
MTLKKDLLGIVVFFMLFGCANNQPQINNSLNKTNKQGNIVQSPREKYISNLNEIEKQTAEDCVSMFGKTIKTASGSELYCKNFMLYMQKLNRNSVLFCKKYNIKGLLPYQCYEINTIGYEIKKKYNLPVNYQIIASLYKKAIDKYKKYRTYSTTNFLLKEKVMNETINNYITIMKRRNK